MFGYVSQNLGWRWIEWIEMIMAGVTTVIVFVVCQETRGSVILSRRAKRLSKETGLDYRCRADEERASLLILMKTGVSRPVWFLLTEPIGARSSETTQQSAKDICSHLIVYMGRVCMGLFVRGKPDGFCDRA